MNPRRIRIIDDSIFRFSRLGFFLLMMLISAIFLSTPATAVKLCASGCTCDSSFVSGATDNRNATCTVTGSQTIDGGDTYYFKSLTINSGVIVTVSTGASGGAATTSTGNPGSSDSGTKGGSGGNGGYPGYGGAGGSVAGGGGGGGSSGTGYYGGAGGSNSGGGGSGVGYSGSYGGAGGNGGGTITINADYLNIAGTIDANGTNGATSTACTYCSGGGGGGGGNVVLNANYFIFTGSINAKSGNGGNGYPGTYGFGGGGGGGGYVNLTYGYYFSGSGTISSVSGGSAGSGGGGSGVAGSTGYQSNQSYQTCVAGFGYNNNTLNMSIYLQNGSILSNANVTIYEAGTNSVICNATTGDDGRLGIGFYTDSYLNKIYDVKILGGGVYQQDIWYRNVRIPDDITVEGNRKWLPESTFAESKKFTAGHIVPLEMHILAPYTIYDVENISIENTVLPNSLRLVSNVVVEKYNSSGRNTCDVLPDNSTYFFIDTSDCAFLDYLNVTAGEWLKVYYDLRIPGPENYTSIGEIKNYTLSDAYLRFDVVF